MRAHGMALAVGTVLALWGSIDPAAAGCWHTWNGTPRDYVPFPAQLPVVERLLEQAEDEEGAAAAATLEHARELDPTDPQVLIELAEAYAKLRRVDEALRIVKEAEALHPHWHSQYYYFGLALLNEGYEREGITYYEHWVDLLPEEAEAHGALGNAYARIDARDQELAAYREAVRLEPENVEWHEGIGRALTQLNRHVEAHAAYLEVVRLEPEYSSGRDALANSYVHLEQYEAAAAEYREVLRLVPCDTFAKEGLAGCLQALGQLEEAERLRAEARRESVEQQREDVADRPDSGYTYRALARALLEEGRTAGAVAALRDAIRVEPSEPDAYTSLADLLEQQGLDSEARQLRFDAVPLLEAELESEPQWMAYTFLRLGNTYAALGNAEAALEAFGKAVALEPTSLDAWMSRGRVLLTVDRPTEAGEAYQRVLDLRAAKQGHGWPVTDIQAYLGLGRVAAAQGDRDSAAHHWRAAWAIAQEHDLRRAYCCKDILAELEAVMPEPAPAAGGA